MSRSERGARPEPVPPEVLAIAVTLAVALQEADEAAGAAEAARPEPGHWPWAGRRWGRPSSYRWS
jgi:hypothetical protein